MSEILICAIVGFCLGLLLSIYDLFNKTYIAWLIPVAYGLILISSYIVILFFNTYA